MVNDEKNEFEPEKSSAGTPDSEIAAVPAAPRKKRSRLKSVFRIAAYVLAFFVFAIVLVVAFFLGPVAKFGINHFGAEILGVDKFQVGDVKIYPFGGYVRFEHLEIGKPIADSSKFSRDLLSVGLVDVDLAFFSLFSQKIVLDRFEVRKVSLCYEKPRSGLSNVDALIQHLHGDVEPEEKTPDEKKTAPEPAEKKEIFIGARYFVIEDVRACAVINGVPMAFPPLSADFSNGVGIEENLTPEEFGMKIAGDFVNAIEFFRKSFVGDAAGAVFGTVSDAASLTSSAAKSAAGTVSDAATLTGDAAKSAASAVSDAASSVFEIFSHRSEEARKKESE